MPSWRSLSINASLSPFVTHGRPLKPGHRGGDRGGSRVVIARVECLPRTSSLQLLPLWCPLPCWRLQTAHCQPVHFGGCSAPRLIVTQGQGVPDHQVLHSSGTLLFEAFCPWCCWWSPPTSNSSRAPEQGGYVIPCPPICSLGKNPGSAHCPWELTTTNKQVIQKTWHSTRVVLTASGERPTPMHLMCPQ